MSKRCEICGRKPFTANKRSHSMVATKRKQYLNLQTKKINGKKIKICVNCLKTMRKGQK
ncbi:MAG: 50S ribosomal protein L28 [Xanthomonadaceae bacterium]|nr:50S ribosomal protein L28 [Rhodospirillaceae bacterium]NIA18212.1 50S ribosomal protein L28 [Xanthomonadaceae bacterium]